MYVELTHWMETLSQLPAFCHTFVTFYTFLIHFDFYSKRAFLLEAFKRQSTCEMHWNVGQTFSLPYDAHTLGTKWTFAESCKLQNSIHFAYLLNYPSLCSYQLSKLNNGPQISIRDNFFLSLLQSMTSLEAKFESLEARLETRREKKLIKISVLLWRFKNRTFFSEQMENRFKCAPQ